MGRMWSSGVRRTDTGNYNAPTGIGGQSRPEAFCRRPLFIFAQGVLVNARTKPPVTAPAPRA